MSSPCDTNTSQIPATGTKRRYLGATRRKRTSEISSFSSPLTSTSSCSKQLQQQTTLACTDSGTRSETQKQCDSDQSEVANTRERTCEQLQVDSNCQTPANDTTRKSRIFMRSGKSQIMQTVKVEKVDKDGTTGPSSSPSTRSLVSTPIHRLPTRHSLGGSARKRLKHDDFKSPVRGQTDKSKCVETAESLTKEVEQLQQTSEELQAEIASLTNEGYCEEELQTHIEKMHEYNELKDTGQMLLGKIALVEGVTTKDLYERFGLNLDD